jgi:hypothetical protein
VHAEPARGLELREPEASEHGAQLLGRHGHGRNVGRTFRPSKLGSTFLL